MKKILLVFGTRPEAIKMAPVVNVLRKLNKYEVRVAVTAQHRQMLDQVLELFEISPDYDLNIMKKNQDLYDITSRILLGMRKIFQQFSADLVLVHGDTTTSMTVAMAAFYMKIPVGHVEAGLRTGDIYSPWPEEMNRLITKDLSSIHFAPTDVAKNNLVRENVSLDKIFVTGNTVIDALIDVLSRIKTNKYLLKGIKNQLRKYGYPLPVKEVDILNLPSNNRELILVTGHRRENFGDGLIQICLGLKKIAQSFSDIDIVYPVHLNPNVQKPVYELLGGIENIFLIPPLDYLPFVYLMDRCKLIISDSGGVQEEAPSLGKPVLVTRVVTERPEAVKAGTVLLVGANSENIYREASKLLTDAELYKKMSMTHNPYGNGSASEQISKHIKNLLN